MFHATTYTPFPPISHKEPPLDPSLALIIAAGIAAIGSIISAVFTVINRGKLDVIHVLVNSNLAEIKRQLDVATAELARRDELPQASAPHAPPAP